MPSIIISFAFFLNLCDDVGGWHPVTAFEANFSMDVCLSRGKLARGSLAKIPIIFQIGPSPSFVNDPNVLNFF